MRKLRTVVKKGDSKRLNVNVNVNTNTKPIEIANSGAIISDNAVRY